MCKLEKCPFCGGEARIQLTDEEGNFRDSDYLQDPWSGVGYVLVHDVPECPISKPEGEIVGSFIYDSEKDAAEAWNKRFNGGSNNG